MKNGLPPTLNRAGALVISVLIVLAFVLLSIRGAHGPVPVAWLLNIFGRHVGSQYPEPALNLFFARLPSTLALMVFSLVIAALATFGLSAMSSRVPIRFRPIAENITVLLRSIPFVWLAAIVALLVVMYGKLPGDAIGPSALPYFDLRDQVAHLIPPSICLALFQIPFLAGAKSLGDLYRVFAKSLPQILGALVVTETFFAWPGDGRLLYQALSLGAPSVAVSLLLIASVSVLLMRIGLPDAQA
jgi:ABC-type dipeptide/oligopeptide/nickel transport system permease component